MTKISLTDLVNLQNETTAVNAINANNAVLETASNNTLSRDGTSPNTMLANLDMNSNQIINLPAPATASSPARLQDVVGNATVVTVPAGGTTGQALSKTSNADYAMGWTSAGGVSAGTNISVSGSNPTTVSTITSPTFATVTTPTLINTGTLTLPIVTDTLIARTTTDTLTNKSINATNNTLSNIPLSALTTQNAFTFVGNNTSSGAIPTAVDIAGLTTKASPAAGDFLLLSDQAASGTWKKATVSSVGSTSGVSSIAGNSGAFTLSYPLGNSTNALLASLSTASNVLGADVNLNNISNYFDGPSMAQGTTGTWLVFGSVTLVDTTSANFNVKLWDATTTVASAALFTGANENISVQLSGIFVNPVANIRISVNDGSNATGKIIFNRTANSKDSYIWGVRIA